MASHHVALRHVASCRKATCHWASRLMATFHATSCVKEVRHVGSRHMAAHHMATCHMESRHMVSRHWAKSHMGSRHTAFCDMGFRHMGFRHVASCRRASLHMVSQPRAFRLIELGRGSMGSRSGVHNPGRAPSLPKGCFVIICNCCNPNRLVWSIGPDLGL